METTKTMPLTQKQQIEKLMLDAEDADEWIVGNVNGHKVEIRSRLARRKVYGKRATRYEVNVDGQRLTWSGNTRDTYKAIKEHVDPTLIAEREQRQKRAETDREQRETERLAAAERMKPLLEDCKQKVDAAVGTLMEDWLTDGTDAGFTEAEIIRAFQQVTDGLRVA